jgi:hypothetical protein
MPQSRFEQSMTSTISQDPLRAEFANGCGANLNIAVLDKPRADTIESSNFRFTHLNDFLLRSFAWMHARLGHMHRQFRPDKCLRLQVWRAA